MRKHLVWALGLALAVGVSAIAYGANTTQNTQKMKVTLTPNKGGKTKGKFVSLRSLTTTGTKTSGTYALTPVSKAQIFYDKDIAFDTKGLKTCDSATIQGTTTAAALAACGPAKVGKGQAVVQIAGDPAPANTVSAVITAFNGKPKGGKPVILLHTRVDAIASTTVLVGTLNKIKAGKFGWRLDVVVPPLPAATATTIFDVTVKHSPVKVGKRKHTYVTAKCSHKNRKWAFKGKFTYKSDPIAPPAAGSITVTSSQGCKVG